MKFMMRSLNCIMNATLLFLQWWLSQSCVYRQWKYQGDYLFKLYACGVHKANVFWFDVGVMSKHSIYVFDSDWHIHASINFLVRSSMNKKNVHVLEQSFHLFIRKTFSNHFIILTLKHLNNFIKTQVIATWKERLQNSILYLTYNQKYRFMIL